MMCTATAAPLSEVSWPCCPTPNHHAHLDVSVEAVVSIGAAWHAHSPALFAFGGDSSIELLSQRPSSLWSFRFELQ